MYKILWLRQRCSIRVSKALPLTLILFASLFTSSLETAHTHTHTSPNTNNPNVNLIPSFLQTLNMTAFCRHSDFGLEPRGGAFLNQGQSEFFCLRAAEAQTNRLLISFRYGQLMLYEEPECNISNISRLLECSPMVPSALVPDILLTWL